MDEREPSILARFVGWLWRDGQVWIVVFGLLFLVVVNLSKLHFWSGK